VRTIDDSRGRLFPSSGNTSRKNRTRSPLGAFMNVTMEPTSLSTASEVTDTSTFEAFYLAQHERLFQALYLLTGDRFEADDLAQEALLRTYERWDRVAAMDSPAGYVYRTALNLHRSRLRSVLLRMRRRFAAVPGEDLSGPVSASHDIRTALAELPRGQREAVILVEWLGLGSAEAGRVLGIDASSVRGRLHRARASLQEKLEDDHE
jgi:RNA polymerase sigma-70 factor (ECF subfamily)